MVVSVRNSSTSDCHELKAMTRELRCKNKSDTHQTSILGLDPPHAAIAKDAKVCCFRGVIDAALQPLN